MCPCKCDPMNENLTGFTMMRFIGKPNGVYMKGAPGRFRQGEVYRVPWIYAKMAYWEPLDPIPELKVPPPSEEELNIGAFIAPVENMVLSEPESEEERLVRNETESLGDGILGENGIVPKRRRSKVA